MTKPEAALGSDHHDLSIVLTTVPDLQVGERLVRALVEERLIACGNLVPGIESIYRWEGSVTREAEVLVVMKAPGSLVELLFDRVRELHPYSVPELIELPVDRVARAYCDWVIASTKVTA